MADRTEELIRRLQAADGSPLAGRLVLHSRDAQGRHTIGGGHSMMVLRVMPNVCRTIPATRSAHAAAQAIVRT